MSLCGATVGCFRYPFVKKRNDAKNCLKMINIVERPERLSGASRNTRIGCVLLRPGTTGDTAMTDLLALVTHLKRPRLLIRAARLGQLDYNRDRDLRRLMRMPAAPNPEQALARLLAEEERLEAERREGDAGYNLPRHIEVLIAMIAEVRLLHRSAAGA